LDGQTTESALAVESVSTINCYLIQPTGTA